MTIDWKQRGGQVNAGMQLPPMDLNKEHLFELLSVEIQEGVTTKFGLKNKVKMVWKEAGKEKDYHRVWVNFNESYAEKSNLVAFLKRASPKVIVSGVDIKLGDYLDIGMQIKAMLQARMDTKTGQPSGYYDFVPASIRPATLLPSASSVTVLQALSKYAVGAKSSREAFGLLVGKVPNELIQEFIAVDKRGEIKYPIQ
jgi:hypothetical protein